MNIDSEREREREESENRNAQVTAVIAEEILYIAVLNFAYVPGLLPSELLRSSSERGELFRHKKRCYF
jgi:hypothetical protein